MAEKFLFDIVYFKWFVILKYLIISYILSQKNKIK